MRGVSLPVNTTIIIIMAILVLGVVTYFFISGTNPLKSASYEQAFNTGCKAYLDRGLSPNQISEVKVGDINNDGEEENLLDVCRVYFSDSDMSAWECEQQCKKRFPGS